MKFKVGDRIVVVSAHNTPQFIGKLGTVTVLKNDVVQVELDENVKWLDHDRKDWDAKLEILELEEIYHSPLYKALC